MMIDRRTVSYVAGLATLCTLVVLGMFYFVKPLVEVKPPSVCKPPQDPKGGVSQKEKDIYRTSLSKIQTVPEEQKPVPPAGDVRNPFIWEGEIGPKQVEQEDKEPLTPPRLGMIVFGPDARLAFLDQKLVREGTQHGGFRVERIAPRSVTLSRGKHEWQLMAPTDHFGPAEVKRSGKDKP